MKAMWALINTLQFIVTMAAWQIPYSDLCLTVLYNLRKMVFGEVFDDFDFAGAFKEKLGLSSESTAVQDRVGTERFGPSNILENFGSTLLIVSICVIFICLTIIVVQYLMKRYNASEKWKKRAEELKKMIFYNSMI